MDGEHTINRLCSFARHILDFDTPGAGTCEICGRSGVQTVRKSVLSTATLKIVGRVSLCGPCLREDREIEP